MNKFFLTFFVVIFLGSAPVFSTELPRPNKFGGDFSLSSTLSKEASLRDWRGKVVLLNFGFTSCPDVCPMVLSKMALVQNELDKSNKKIQVVFVTIDPGRDTLEKMQDYLKHYHNSFVGMRGSDEKVQGILRRYGASAQQHHSKSGVIEFSHSDYVYVIDKKGYVAGFYDVKVDYKTLLQAVEKLL